jgi:hypothetical protein
LYLVRLFKTVALATLLSFAPLAVAEEGLWSSLMTYPEDYLGGVNVSQCMDAKRAGFYWFMVTAPATMGGPVKLWQYQPGTWVVVKTFLPFAHFPGGINVSCLTWPGFNLVSVMMAAGEGGGPHVRTEIVSVEPFEDWKDAPK